MHDGATLADAADDTLLGATVGSFRITRLMGKGGMGRVYRAVQPAIGGRVAIKVLTDSGHEGSIERFFSEAIAVNMIRHEKIVNILDLATLPDGRPYIVMEFLDGSPLSQLFRTRGALPIGGFARFMLEVLDAVGAAHQRGVVHRDLKPDNIFVSPAGHATVLDFGIAKLAQLAPAGLTQTGQLIGTPKYMSPEQAMGRATDARSDVYSLGLILYEGVTGTHPFKWTNVYELLKMHVESPIEPPTRRRADVAPGLEAVIMTALQKDANQRFRDAAAMRRALFEVGNELPPDSLDVVGAPQSQRANFDKSAPTDEAIAALPENSAPPTYAPTTIAEPPKPIPSGQIETVRTRRRFPLVLAVAVPVLALIGLAVVLYPAKSSTSRAGSELAVHAKPEPSSSAAPKGDEPLPPPPSPAELMNFDVVGFVDKATAHARDALGPDAKMWMFTAPAAGTNGKVTITDNTLALYYFVSLARMKHPGGCGLMVSVSTLGVNTQKYADPACDRNLIPKPTCSYSEALAKAKAKGFVASTPIINISFTNFAYGPRWLVVTQDATSQLMIPDDCGGS